MREKNQTKRALLTSLLSMMLCVVLLIGTTFAWFTDSVTSGGNKIVAGNLDVELYHTNKVDDKESVGETTKLFDDITLWEPGAVVYETFTVENNGNLALKYRFDLNQLATEDFNTVTWVGDNNTYDLTDVVKVAVVEDTAFDGDREVAKQLAYKDWEEASSNAVVSAMLAPEMSNTFTVVLYWEPGATDNFYNLKNDGWTLDKTNADGESVLFINAGVSLYATQAISESDSFGPYYDESAQVPNGPVIENDAAVVQTTNDKVTVYMQDVTPEGDGHTTIVFPSGSFAEENKKLQVNIETKNLSAVNPNFEVDATGMGAVAAVDVTATVDGNEVTSFNGQKVQIETYIEAGLAANELVLSYVDDAGIKTKAADSNGDFAIVSYDATTGKVVFETNHFSTYEFSAPLVTIDEDGVYGVQDVRGLYVMTNAQEGATFALESSLVFDDEMLEDVADLKAQGVDLTIKNDITLDTGSFRMKLTKVPMEIAEGVTLTLIGEADIDEATFDSLKASAGKVKVQGCNFIGKNPAELDESLKASDSTYIAVNYKKDNKEYYIVNNRATTVVLGATDTTYTPTNGNYSVKTMVDGSSLYYALDALKNNDFNTVYLLPGTYSCTTVAYVRSSMDIVGLGDVEDIEIVKGAVGKKGNCHIFNCSGEKSEHIQVTIRNMYLNVAKPMSDDKKGGNAAVQSIRKTKVKCYDLKVFKASGDWLNAVFCVNTTNAVDGVIYPAYMYVENTTVNVTSRIHTFSGTKYAFNHYGLTYADGTKTYTQNSGKIKNIQMAPDDWEW